VINWLASGSLLNIAEYRFSSRLGGVSAGPFDELNLANWVGDDPEKVKANKELLAQSTGLQLHFMEPEHGTVVQDVSGDEVMLKKADIIVTTKKLVALVAPSADCVSLVATSAKKPFLLLAHIGWRGAAAGIAQKILTTASLYGVNSTDLNLILGPAICGHCYPVSKEVQLAVTENLPAAELNKKGHSGVDLRVGLTDFFIKSGVTVTNNLPCTFETEALYSYRREGRTGRQAVIAWLT